jgi:hypothetical protein
MANLITQNEIRTSATEYCKVIGSRESFLKIIIKVINKTKSK